MEAPRVRYTTAIDGVEIAYALVGEGTPEGVYVPGLVSHLDLQWGGGPHDYFTELLARRGTAVTFDKRGTGLSGRSGGWGSLDERSLDLKAVCDATGIESADFVGISEGGPLSVLFAASYPEKVRSLVLYGTFARLFDVPGYSGPWNIELDVDVVREYLIGAWGTGEPLRGMLQGVSDDATEALAAYERSSCTPAVIADLMAANLQIDVRPLLGSINVPTLVVHCTGDPVISVQQGREVAEGIPDAEYVEIDLPYHAATGAEAMLPVLEAVEDFLDRQTGGAGSQRMLASVLFTDIVASTEKATALGDRAWTALLDRHDELVRAEVERLGGSVVKATGDGILALFDSPSRAIEGARCITRAISPLGIEVRAGVHTGEVERRGEDVGGIGVHIGARVAGLAGGGEVLVSRTVRDLTLGSQIEFADRGRHLLKGVPDEWELFSVTS